MAVRKILLISVIFCACSILTSLGQETDWIVYEPQDFDKNELCGTLTCESGDLCLVGPTSNAECVKRDQLDSYEGTKRFFVPSTDTNNKKAEAIEDSKNPLDDDWDQERLRQKLLKFEQTIKEKEKLKSDRDRPNEVHHFESDLDKVQHSSPTHERHDPKMKKIQNCTQTELKSVKGRLYKWFADIHALQKNEPFYELPKHDISCNEDVGFMFHTLDGDQSGQLTLDELFSLDYDPHEKCVKPLLDRCDLDSDDDLSLDEWCSCFQWSEDEYHEPACHAALRKHNPHDPDSFLPECDQEGFYKLDQCQKGMCWCTDKWGREFDRSRTKGKANCHRYVL